MQRRVWDPRVVLIGQRHGRADGGLPTEDVSGPHVGSPALTGSRTCNDVRGVLKQEPVARFVRKVGPRPSIVLPGKAPPSCCGLTPVTVSPAWRSASCSRRRLTGCFTAMGVDCASPQVTRVAFNEAAEHGRADPLSATISR